MTDWGVGLEWCALNRVHGVDGVCVYVCSRVYLQLRWW